MKKKYYFSSHYLYLVVMNDFVIYLCESLDIFLFFCFCVKWKLFSVAGFEPQTTTSNSCAFTKTFRLFGNQKSTVSHPRYLCSAAFLSSSVALIVFFLLQHTILMNDFTVGTRLKGGGTVDPSSKYEIQSLPKFVMILDSNQTVCLILRWSEFKVYCFYSVLIARRRGRGSVWPDWAVNRHLGNFWSPFWPKIISAAKTTLFLVKSA